ncbi:MAG: DUF5058 family protein [Lachnospirales bacterium]
MDNALQIATSPIFWIFAIITVGLAVLQAYLIYNKTKSFINETNLLTNDEVKSSLKVGGIVAIGPAISVFVVALSMEGAEKVKKEKNITNDNGTKIVR